MSMKYVCQVCGYIYDDEKEDVLFASLPDDWVCPWCKAPKSAFKAEEQEEKKVSFEPVVDADMIKIDTGLMAALCSNLARGADKQYKQEISELYSELADYFTQITPSIDPVGVDLLAEMMGKDIDHYPGARAVAENSSDRGAMRALVWGEKVTRMLQSLVEQYMKDGDKMLTGTDIWLCTACGFVYIGDEPPESCPVCKVPSSRFEKIQGR